MSRSDWPEALTDAEALMRLQSVLISACEGNRDLTNDRDYKSLRTPLIRRDDLRDVVPQYIRSHRDLQSLWSYLKGISPQWQPRREHIWESFKPLLDRAEGRTKPPIRSTRWTGKRTANQQARVVLSLAPDALHGVEMLLEDQERPLHNGGPAYPEQVAALAQLRALHNALGDLIRLTEAELPIGEQLRKVAELKRATFSWAADTFRLTVAGAPLMTASTVMGCGVMMLINAITKGAVDAETMGAAAMGVHATAAHQVSKGKASN